MSINGSVSNHNWSYHMMTYTLKFYGSGACVRKGAFEYAVLNFESPGTVELSVPTSWADFECSTIIAPNLRELASFVKVLPAHRHDIELLQRDKPKLKHILWRLETIT